MLISIMLWIVWQFFLQQIDFSLRPCW